MRDARIGGRVGTGFEAASTRMIMDDPYAVKRDERGEQHLLLFNSNPETSSHALGKEEPRALNLSPFRLYPFSTSLIA